MRCLVTGGAGFIGSHVAEALVRRGDEVVVLDNFSTGSQDNLRDIPTLEVVKGDVRDSVLVAALARGTKAIFHLAAEVGNLKSLRDPGLDASVNILGTINVLRCAVDCVVKKVVYSSSAAIFGEARFLPVDESHPTQPESFYAVSKLAGEKYALSFARLFPIETVCLRYFNVYGPRQGHSEYASVIPIFAERLSKGLPPVIYGDGEQTRDFVSVHDIAAANVLAADSSFSGEVFNIGSGVRTSVNRLNEVMQASMCVRLAPFHAPPRAGEVRHSLADISKAGRMLGYAPSVSMEGGIAELVSWLREGS
ncbi:MAG: NAD-dependent epimerase/dehydratase family protein [Chloroflexi bacterium]|nr:NAD-dependent epimerase/dehydratase family protein [Chloroflexota bacterium]